MSFNPKASPSEERESGLQLYSSPGSGDESHSYRPEDEQIFQLS